MSNENELVSTNFIEAIINEDIENGQTEIVTRFSAGAKWLFAHRPREVDLFELRPGEKIWWHLPPAF